MSSRRSPRALFSGLGLIVLGMVLLSACASNQAAIVVPGHAAATAAATPSEGLLAATAPAVPVGSIATATLPAAKKSSSKSSSKGASKTAGQGAAASGAASSQDGAGAAPGSAATSSGGTIYGISDPAILNETSAQQIQDLEAMKAMGVTSVRLEASWNTGQPTGSGTFDFTVLDQVVAALQKVGLSADLDIDKTPTWAAVSAAAGNEWAQPASASAFATWAGAVAGRYANSGVVASYEIWNEENVSGFWAPTPDPAAYTADLKAAYAAIKQADPSAVVISGGLAPALDTSTTYNARTFLTDMYADGAEGSFDGLGYHPYSYPATPDEYESWSGWSQMSQTSPSLRSIMAANGDSAKKIWMTEFGAPTSGPDSVGETGQTDDLVQGIAQVRGLSWVGSLYIYTWADLSSLSADEDGFGMLNDDGTQKPSYAAVTAALAGT